KPSVRSAPIIKSVSRLRSAPLIVEVPWACAADSPARISARLVCDFEPGTVTVAWTGVGALGAVQGSVLTASSCRVVRRRHHRSWGGTVARARDSARAGGKKQGDRRGPRPPGAGGGPQLHRAPPPRDRARGDPP